MSINSGRHKDNEYGSLGADLTRSESVVGLDEAADDGPCCDVTIQFKNSNPLNSCAGRSCFDNREQSQLQACLTNTAVGAGYVVFALTVGGPIYAGVELYNAFQSSKSVGYIRSALVAMGGVAAGFAGHLVGEVITNSIGLPSHYHQLVSYSFTCVIGGYGLGLAAAATKCIQSTSVSDNPNSLFVNPRLSGDSSVMSAQSYSPTGPGRVIKA